MLKRYIISTFFFFLFLASIFTQDQFVLHEDSKISVEGSSTLTDWKAAVNQFEGKALAGNALNKKSLKAGEVLTSLSLTCDVATMDGGRGPAMNKKIKTALKVTEHPQITFEATSGSIKEIKNKAEQSFIFLSKGMLTIAGVAQEVEIELEGKKDDGKLLLNGSKDLKMSNFQIEAPSAMFGQIETKDDISIHFELILTQNQ